MDVTEQQPTLQKPVASSHAPFWRRAHLAELMKSRRNGLLIPTVFAVPGVLYLFGISIWQCPMHSTTGLPCPGCGMTRAFEAGLLGHLADMLAFHPLSPVIAALFALLFVSALLPDKARKPLIRLTARLEALFAPAPIILSAFIVLFICRLFGAFPIPG